MVIVDYIPSDTTLTLRNGQHRVAALKDLCENLENPPKKGCLFSNQLIGK